MVTWAPVARSRASQFCALADTFALTPCFSWGLDDVPTRQPFQRLSADGKPLKAVARLRPPSRTLLKQGDNERAVDMAVRQRCLLVQELRFASARLGGQKRLDFQDQLCSNGTSH